MNVVGTSGIHAGATITDLLAYGGGVNSTALAVLLVSSGWRGHIVFADTGAEYPDTYDFIFSTFSEWLRGYGLHIDVVGSEFRSEKFKLSLPQLIDVYGMIPSVKKRWCTTEYKIAPFERWCKRHELNPDLAMVGIAYDESHRRKDRIRPLVEMRITRDQCAEIIRSAGLPVPRKSGCFCCPFQSRSQWIALKRLYPERFAFLVWIESRTGLKFHPDGELYLSQITASYGQTEMFDFSEFYRPCLCKD
jgi:hypothetical protein